MMNKETYWKIVSACLQKYFNKTEKEANSLIKEWKEVSDILGTEEETYRYEPWNTATWMLDKGSITTPKDYSELVLSLVDDALDIRTAQFFILKEALEHIKNKGCTKDYDGCFKECRFEAEQALERVNKVWELK